MVMVLLHRIAMKLYIILRQLVSEYLNQNAKTIFIVQIFLQVDKKKKKKTYTSQISILTQLTIYFYFIYNFE